MWKPFVCAAIIASPAYAEARDASVGWTADTVPWQTAAPNGTRYALLEGARDRPDTAFSYAFSIPASVWDTPHYHSATARIFVAKGILRIGYGVVADKKNAKAYPTGSYVVVPAGAVHFDGSDEDMILIGTAIGPWTTVYIDGSSPASAGTPINP